MIKAKMRIKGRETLIIGLSFGNLDRFRAKPLDTFVPIDGREMGLPFDVMIFSGETEADMVDMMSQGFGPETEIHISQRLKQ
jgi:hypothetical protein